MHKFVDALFVIIQRKPTGPDLYVINSCLIAGFSNLTFNLQSSWLVDNFHTIGHGPLVEVLFSPCLHGTFLSLPPPPSLSLCPDHSPSTSMTLPSHVTFLVALVLIP